MKSILIARILAVLAVVSTNAWGQIFDETFEPLDTPKEPPALVPVAEVPKVTPVDLGRHHIHLGVIGMYRAFNSALNFQEMDARTASAADMCYRYSFSPRWDLAVDLHGWGHVKQEAASGEFTIDGVASGLGVGCRYNIPFRNRRLYPYLQANAYRVAVGMEAMSNWLPYIWKREGSGWGAGVNTGAELRLGRLVTIPVEIYCLAANPTVTYTGNEITIDQYGNPGYNPIRRSERFSITGVGFTAGITFNWGKI